MRDSSAEPCEALFHTTAVPRQVTSAAASAVAPSEDSSLRRNANSRSPAAAVWRPSKQTPSRCSCRGEQQSCMPCSGLSFVIEFFDKLNKELQTDKATIHRVERSLESLYGKLLLCFVKPSALSSGALLDVHFISRYNIHDSKHVRIG